MRYRIMVLLFSTALLVESVSGQNVHLSQFHQAPLLVNPALTGVFNGDQRAILNYRNQWASVADPFTTYAFSYDMSLFKEKGKNKYLGGGIYFFRDVAGDTKYSTTSANLSLSSIITLDGGHDLSVGLQGGFAQKSIDENSFQCLADDEDHTSENGFSSCQCGCLHQLDKFKFYLDTSAELT